MRGEISVISIHQIPTVQDDRFSMPAYLFARTYAQWLDDDNDEITICMSYSLRICMSIFATTLERTKVLVILIMWVRNSLRY